MSVYSLYVCHYSHYINLPLMYTETSLSKGDIFTVKAQNLTDMLMSFMERLRLLLFHCWHHWE